MTIQFTEQEKKWVVTKNEGYGLACDKNAPPEIKESIERKLNAHKIWIEKNKKVLKV